MSILKDIFGTEKPIIGMVHFLPLPGSPLYDPDAGISTILNMAKREAELLEKAGFDGIIFSNEGDRPYLGDVGKEIVAIITRLVYQVSSSIDVPFGVSVLADPEAAISVASAVEADFVRIFLSWVYISDWGIVDPGAGKLQRLKRNIYSKIKVFANISGHTEPLGNRKIEDLAIGAVKFGLADALCLAGTTAGSPVLEDDIINAKKGVMNIPVLVGSGVNIDNVEKYLKISDGVIVGTSLKINGNTFNPLDPDRVNSFITKAKEVRNKYL